MLLTMAVFVALLLDEMPLVGVFLGLELLSERDTVDKLAVSTECRMNEI